MKIAQISSLMDDIIDNGSGQMLIWLSKVDATIEGKIRKLFEMSHENCYKIYIGKQEQCCPTLRSVQVSYKQVSRILDPPK